MRNIVGYAAQIAYLRVGSDPKDVVVHPLLMPKEGVAGTFNLFQVKSANDEKSAD